MFKNENDMTGFKSQKKEKEKSQTYLIYANIILMLMPLKERGFNITTLVDRNCTSANSNAITAQKNNYK